MFKFLKWANFQSSSFWLWKNPINCTIQLYCWDFVQGSEMCEICVKNLVAFFALANINEMLTWMTWLLLSGLSLRALSNNTYGWVFSIFPWCYGWNWLLFAVGVDKKVTGDSKRVLTAMVVIVTMWRNDQSNTKKKMGIVCTKGIHRQVSVHTLQ